MILIGGACGGAARLLEGGDPRRQVGAIAHAPGGLFQNASAMILGNELKLVGGEAAQKTEGASA